MIQKHEYNVLRFCSRSSSKDVTIVEDLTRALGDQDMLVREASCLALGMLKSTWAVGRLVEAW